MKRIYLDHSATTRVDTRVLESMLPYFNEMFGNASSLHSFGQEAADALSFSREQVAATIGAEPQEIIFTSGGTESDNMAIKGASYISSSRGKHIISSVIEHPAVLHTCRQLEKEGFEVTYVPVDNEGILDMQFLEDSIREDTILISIMHANNEIGTVQPIKEISELIRGRGIILHTDAVQSVGKIPVDVNELGGHVVYLFPQDPWSKRSGASLLRNGEYRSYWYKAVVANVDYVQALRTFQALGFCKGHGPLLGTMKLIPGICNICGTI